MAKVYVVTSMDSGWDCVVAVYMADEVAYDDLIKAYPEGSDYVISEKTTNSMQNLLDNIKEREEWDTQESF